MTWSGTLAWGLFGVGQLEVANTAAVGSATPVALDGKPLEPGVVYEVWPGARVTAPGLALTVDAPDWTERSARNLVGQVLGLLLLLGLARLATPGLLTRLGVRTEGFAREVKRGAAAYLAFFPVVWAVLMLTQILAGALGYPAQSHPWSGPSSVTRAACWRCWSSFRPPSWPRWWRS